jgi:putative sterol carrier protein
MPGLILTLNQLRGGKIMNAYFTFRPLTGHSGKDLGATFKHMGELIKGAEGSGKLQFQIVSDDQPSYWVIDVSNKNAHAKEGKVDKPDFEIITTAETWGLIAAGSLSPLRAFVDRKIRVRGNLSLGKDLLMRIAEKK